MMAVFIFACLGIIKLESGLIKAPLLESAFSQARSTKTFNSVSGPAPTKSRGVSLIYGTYKKPPPPQRIRVLQETAVAFSMHPGLDTNHRTLSLSMPRSNEADKAYQN